MSRFAVYSLVSMLLLLVGAIAEAAKIIIVAPSAVGRHASIRAFEDAMKKRMGADVNIAWMDFKADEASALPDRLRKENPDLIFTWGTPTTLAVAGPADSPKGIKDIPIVFAFVADPVRSGLVKDLARPGRNLTGASHVAPMQVQFKAIRSYSPLNKLGVVFNPTEQNSVVLVDALKELAPKEQIELIYVPVDVTPDGKPDPASIPDKVATVKARGADWLYMGPDTFISLTHRGAVTKAAAAVGLPTFAATESPIRSGDGLFGLYSANENVGRLAASKASQILRKERPVAEVPVETLQRFTAIVNMNTAKTLDRWPPLALIKIADIKPIEKAPPAPPPAAAPAAAPVASAQTPVAPVLAGTSPKAAAPAKAPDPAPSKAAAPSPPAPGKAAAPSSPAPGKAASPNSPAPGKGATPSSPAPGKAAASGPPAPGKAAAPSSPAPAKVGAEIAGAKAGETAATGPGRPPGPTGASSSAAASPANSGTTATPKAAGDLVPKVGK